MGNRTQEGMRQVVGLDLGDRWSQVCVLGARSGEVVEESRVRTTEPALRKRFSKCGELRIGLETGTHSPWVSRLLTDLGHEVIVANASKLRLIYENRRKSDRVDARYLARLARLDPELLAPVAHRSAQGQGHLAVLRARDALVRSRTRLVSHVRGAVKSMGGRVVSCSCEVFPSKAPAAVPDALAAAVAPLLETITSLTAQIRAYDEAIEALAHRSYPETQLLRQVAGVGPLTSLAFVLTVANPQRFHKSRTVGAYPGLVPARSSSGESDPQRRISRQGDGFLRRLLVNSAHYILGPFGPDCDLRRYGLRLLDRGGRNAKKRAIVAVAQKLAVLLHRLWREGEVYEAFYAATNQAEERSKIA